MMEHLPSHRKEISNPNDLVDFHFFLGVDVPVCFVTEFMATETGPSLGQGRVTLLDVDPKVSTSLSVPLQKPGDIVDLSHKLYRVQGNGALNPLQVAETVRGDRIGNRYLLSCPFLVLFDLNRPQKASQGFAMRYLLCSLLVLGPLIANCQVNKADLAKIVVTSDAANQRWNSVTFTAKLSLEVHDLMNPAGPWITRSPKAYLNIFTDADSMWASKGSSWYCRIAEMSAQSNGQTIKKRVIEIGSDLIGRQVVTSYPTNNSAFRTIFDPLLAGYCVDNLWLSDWIRKKPPAQLTREGAYWKLTWIDRSSVGIYSQNLYLDPARDDIIVRRFDTYIDRRSRKRTVQLDRSILRISKVEGLYLPTQFLSSVDGDQGASLGTGRVTLSNIETKASPLLKLPIEQPGDVIRDNFGTEYSVGKNGSLTALPSLQQKQAQKEKEIEATEMRQYGFLVFAIAISAGFILWLVSKVLARYRPEKEWD